MEADSHLKNLQNDIETAALSIDVAVVRGILVSEKLADVLQVRLDEDDFIVALKALKPRALYILRQDFNAQDFQNLRFRTKARKTFQKAYWKTAALKVSFRGGRKRTEVFAT